VLPSARLALNPVGVLVTTPELVSAVTVTGFRLM
jgi:hypothetical protein